MSLDIGRVLSHSNAVIDLNCLSAVAIVCQWLSGGGQAVQICRFARVARDPDRGLLDGLPSPPGRWHAVAVLGGEGGAGGGGERLQGGEDDPRLKLDRAHRRL